MGPKKIRYHHKHKSSGSHGSPHASPSQPPPPPVSFSSTSSDAVADDTAKAIRTLWRGNHEKALRLLEEAMTKHGDSLPLMHRALGCAHAQIAALMADTPKRRRHLQAALDSARRAAQKEPRSVEFSRFYATAIYEAASSMVEFDAAIEECDRGLAIEDPTDPAIHSVEKKTREALGPTKRSRVAKVRRQLLDLIHKCNTASVTTFVNSLTTTNSSLPPVNFHQTPSQPLDQSSFPTPEPSSVCTDRVRACWDSMLAEQQLAFLRPSVQEIMSHYGKARFSRAHEEVLLDILFHMEAYASCQIWRCCRCQDQEFAVTDFEAFILHISECHMGEMVGQKEANFLDQEVDSNWVNKLTNLIPKTGDDAERTELLERIAGLFGLLIRNESLSVGCVDIVVKYAVEEINKLDGSSELTPTSICLLDGSMLKKVLEFLELVSQFCLIPGLDETATENRTGFIEKVTLDASEASSSSSSSGFLIIDGVEKERILEWIYEGVSCDQSLMVWAHMRREKVKRGASILRALEKQAYLLKCLYNTKKYNNNLGKIASEELKLNKIDALIVGTTMGIRNLQIALAQISFLDFRAVLIPFIKSFLQARLEELVQRNSKEKFLTTENEEPEGRTSFFL